MAKKAPDVGNYQYGFHDEDVCYLHFLLYLIETIILSIHIHVYLSCCSFQFEWKGTVEKEGNTEE
jgi:hypothetical protein